jgi:hypothetical protein
MDTINGATNPVSGGMGRADSFADGMHGGDMTGAGMHPATSIQQNVSPGLQPGSVLELPNVIRSINGQSDQTYQKSQPMESMMRNMAMSPAPPVTSPGGSPVMNV